MSDVVQIHLYFFFICQKNCVWCEVIILSFTENYLHFEELNNLDATIFNFFFK